MLRSAVRCSAVGTVSDSYFPVCEQLQLLDTISVGLKMAAWVALIVVAAAWFYSKLVQNAPKHQPRFPGATEWQPPEL